MGKNVLKADSARSGGLRPGSMGSTGAEAVCSLCVTAPAF